MASSQPEHATLLIPGPIEFDDAVLQSMSHYRYACGAAPLIWLPESVSLLTKSDLLVRAMSALPSLRPLARP